MSAFSKSGGGAVKSEIRQFLGPTPPAGWGRIAGQADFGAVGAFAYIQSPSDAAHAYALAGGMLYAAGTSPSPWLSRYEPGTNEWVSLTPPPSVTSYGNPPGLFVGLSDGRLVLGGAGAAASSQQRLQLFDPTLGAWSSLASAASGQLSVFNASLTLDDGRILTANNSYSNIYDIERNEWQPTNVPALASGLRLCRLPSGKVLAVKASSYAIFDTSKALAEGWGPSSEIAHSLIQPSSTAVLVETSSGAHLYSHAQASAASWQPVAEYNEALDTWSPLANLKTPLNASSSNPSAVPFPGGGWVIAPGMVALTDAFEPVGNCFAAKL